MSYCHLFRDLYYPGGVIRLDLNALLGEILGINISLPPDISVGVSVRGPASEPVNVGCHPSNYRTQINKGSELTLGAEM